MPAAQGSQAGSSFGPSAHTGCAQVQLTMHVAAAKSTQACVQSVSQQLGSCMHTALTQGSGPQVICAKIVQSPFHAGGEPMQQAASAMHVSSTQGSKHLVGSSSAPTTHTECAHSGGGGHAPQSCGHELQSSPLHIPSPQQSVPQTFFTAPTHCPSHAVSQQYVSWAHTISTQGSPQPSANLSPA